MKSKKAITIIVLLALGGLLYISSSKPVFNFFPNSSQNQTNTKVNAVLASKFQYLSQNGNSSCSASFQKSISEMTGDERLRGSCCSPMSLHRYSEQIEGLKEYSSFPEIPPDPYDIEAKLAKTLVSYYDMELNEDEQKRYDFAMMNSDEKGPCCCKCWRWLVYGGLGKYLIHEKGFTGEQVTEVWDLSDGCGGDGEHHHA